MGFQEKVCKLCMEKCEDFEDFTIIQEQVMCKSCAGIPIKCFDFKVTCLHTHNYIAPLVNKKDDIKLDLKNVYRNRDISGTNILEDRNVCAFCMSLVKKCFTISLDAEEGDAILKKMIEQCLPELDLTIFKKSVVCTHCRESLELFFRFVTTCVIVQEKTKKYCDSLDVDNKGQIELNGLLQFTMNNLTASEVDANLVDKINVEHFCEDGKYPGGREIGNGEEVIKFEQLSFDNDEYVEEEIENKNRSFMEMDDQKLNSEHQTPRNMLACEEESSNFGFIKNETKQEEENLVESEDQEFLLGEKIEIKTDESDISGFEDTVDLPHPEAATGLCGSPKCLTPNLEDALSKSYTKQSLTNKNASKKKIIYNCEYCSFQTKYKIHIKLHLIVHKDPSDVTLYKCDSCTFQSKYKRGLRKHSLLHREPSEVIVYKCDSCSFQTKHKQSLNRHLQLEPLNETMYKCDSCSFQTRYKLCLKSHLRSHKDPLEVKMYKCDFCSHQTNHKKNLLKHLIVHKDPSELTMYKCTFCSFQSKHKYGIRKHSIVHKDPSELTMYDCASCSFQTRHKNALKKHLLGHASEVIMYKCDSCSFQTKTVTYLKSHMLVHKDPSEVIMHNCDSCWFQTKRKESLKRHSMRHKKPS